MGLTRAAFQAGIIPARVPATIRRRVASRATSRPTEGFTSIWISSMPMLTVFWPMVLSITWQATMPRNIPIYPKAAVMTTLSAMMSLRMAPGLAPMALRIPNSWVRSFTVMSMMLDTPTMPLIRVRRPRIHRAVRIIRVALFICIFCVYPLSTHRPRLSSGSMLCIRLRAPVYSASRALNSASVLRPFTLKLMPSILSE